MLRAEGGILLRLAHDMQGNGAGGGKREIRGDADRFHDKIGLAAVTPVRDLVDRQKPFREKLLLTFFHPTSTMTLKIILKYLLSAGIITLVSEMVKRSDKLGALLAALPFVSIITLFWVHHESAPEVREQKTADHMYYIFWYVLPTLPMFLLFPLFQRWWGFYGALGGSAALTLLLFALLRAITARFGLML